MPARQAADFTASALSTVRTVPDMESKWKGMEKRQAAPAFGHVKSKLMSLSSCLAEVESAAERIAPHVHRTPVLTCASLDERAGASLFFKCENLQKAGAFKFRGACNAVFSLSGPELSRGVITHSSGNHGAALALAARRRGARAVVVTPRNSTTVKKAAMRHYGADLIECEPNDASRQETVDRVLDEHGMTFVSPYDDARIICGQGTAALELLEQVPDLDLVLTPVGGGGLLSGTAVVVKESRPTVAVIGVEPRAADDTWRSFESGRIVRAATGSDTIADGLRTGVGELTFPIIKDRVDRIVTVSEDAIVAAMRSVWERMKIVVEPSAAVPLAAVLDSELDVRGQRTGIILSGGNVDLDCLPWSQEGVH